MESNNLFVRALYGLSKLKIGAKLSDTRNDDNVKMLKIYDALNEDNTTNTFDIMIFDFLKCVNKILINRHYNS